MTLQANQVYVLAHGDASDAIKAVADITDKSVANFNGDDPIALLKDGEVHDIIGVMGDVDFGKDTTLVRNSDALTLLLLMMHLSGRHLRKTTLTVLVS